MSEGEGKRSYRESSSSIRGVVEPLLGDDKMLFNAKTTTDLELCWFDHLLVGVISRLGSLRERTACSGDLSVNDPRLNRW